MPLVLEPLPDQLESRHYYNEAGPLGIDSYVVLHGEDDGMPAEFRILIRDLELVSGGDLSEAGDHCARSDYSPAKVLRVLHRFNDLIRTEALRYHIRGAKFVPLKLNAPPQ